MKTNTRTNQVQRVHDYLRGKGSINPMTAWNKLGVYRLSAVIFELRKQGHDIVTEEVKIRNTFDEDCRVAKYVLCV